MKFFNDNRAITIAIDTILIFGILTTFLTITYLSMDALNQSSERAVMREEFSTIGHDIARKFVNLNSEVSASFAYGNDVDFEYKVDIPILIAGDPYEVSIDGNQVIVESKGGQDVTVVVPFREDLPVHPSTISSTGKGHIIAYDKPSGLVWFKSNSNTPPPDNEPPTINITLPESSDYDDDPIKHISNSKEISVDLFDNVAIARVEYYTTYHHGIPGENERTILRDSVVACRDCNWTWETVVPCATIQIYANGNYTLKAIVYDRAGNWAEAERDYYVNNTNYKGPVISYLKPTNSSTWCESSDVVIELDYCDTYPGVNISTGRLWLSAWNESDSGFDDEIDLGPLIDQINVTEVNLTDDASFTQTQLLYRIPYDSPVLDRARIDNESILFKVTVSLNDTDRSNITDYPDGRWLEEGYPNTSRVVGSSNLSWKFIYNVTQDNVPPYTNISYPQDKEYLGISGIDDPIRLTYLASDDNCGLRSVLLEARDYPGGNLLASRTFNYSGVLSTDTKIYSLDAYYQKGITYNLSITAWDWGNNTNTTSHTVYTTCTTPGFVTTIRSPSEGIWGTSYASQEIPIYARVTDDCAPTTNNVTATITNGSGYVINYTLAYDSSSRLFIGSWNFSGVNLSETYQMNVSAINGTDLVNGTIEIGWTGVNALVGYGEQYNVINATGSSDSWITNGTGDGDNLAELRNFFVTNNATHIFFRVNLAGNYSIYNDISAPTDIAIFIDADQDSNTGYNNNSSKYFPLGMGADFAIFDADGTAPLHNWSGFGLYNSSGSWFAPLASTAQNRTVDSSPDWVEMWLPLAALNVSVNDTITLIAQGRDNFTIDQIPNPVPYNNATGTNYGANYTIT